MNDFFFTYLINKYTVRRTVISVRNNCGTLRVLPNRPFWYGTQKVWYGTLRVFFFLSHTVYHDEEPDYRSGKQKLLLSSRKKIGLNLTKCGRSFLISSSLALPPLCFKRKGLGTCLYFTRTEWNAEVGRGYLVNACWLF